MGENKKLDTSDNSKTIAWLLESPTPSIRYLTLTRILGKPEGDAETQAARRSIAGCDPAARMLAKQNADGSWQNPRHYYSPKYRSSHWSMLLLSELGVEPQHPALQRGAAFMRACFANDKRLHSGTETFWGCLWGNMLRYQLYCQAPQDELMAFVLDYVTRDLQNFSRCRYNNGLPCAWGVARDLFGLALLPEEKRNPSIRQAIRTGLKFLLEDHDLLKADYPHVEKIHELWSKTSFPLFYHADILFVLRVARELNALEYPQAQRALVWLREQRNQNGTWSGGSPFQQRTWPLLAQGDSIQRWITLQALSVLS